MSRAYSIVHLDIARKYFSPEQLHAFIDCLSENSIDQLELYFSDNQGFRLAVDDMVFNVNGVSYDLSKALGDGITDSSSGMTPDGSGKYLSAAEMTDIINYASIKNVEIVPAFDMPGHMGAILQYYPQFCYKAGDEQSVTSLDFTSPEAIDFSLAVFERYVSFFATNGCRHFNAVCDEVALEMGGIERIYNDGRLEQLINYITKLVGIIKDHEMVPRIFNDALYYGNDPAYDTDSSAEVCYCIPSGGSAAKIAKTHPMINGSTDLFWVMGVPDWQVDIQRIRSFKQELFSDGSTAKTAGNMLCFWCDKANAMTGEEFLSAAAPLINVFGIKLEKYNQKMSVRHDGVCSSPYYKGCPCPRECPLHGRCCDCVHHHIDERIEAGEPAENTDWLVECMKLAHEGRFEEIYVHKNES